MNKNFVESVSKYRTYLMGVSIIMIMFYHNQWVRDVVWLKPINFYGDFGVDVFLFVSGFGIFHSLRKNTIAIFFRNRFFRLMPLCIICGIFKYLLGHFILKDDACWSWQTFIGFELWYIKAIIILYCLSPLFYRYLSKYGFLMFIFGLIVAIGALQVTSNQTLCLFLPRVPVYLLGMMVANGMIKFSKRLLLFSFLFFIVAVLHRWSIIETWFILGNSYYTVLFLSIGILFLLWGLMQIYKLFDILKIKTLFDFSGKHSLELYLVHQFIYFSIIPKYFSQVPPVLQFITAVLLSYASAYLVSALNAILTDLPKLRKHS